MFRQNAAGEGFNFAESDRLKSACPLKAKAKAADAAEQVKDTQLHSPAPMPIISIRYRQPNRQATPIMSRIILRPSCGLR
jgi:hypothetical protein